MEGKKLKKKERDFENRRGWHGGERRRKYTYRVAGALHPIIEILMCFRI